MNVASTRRRSFSRKRPRPTALSSNLPLSSIIACLSGQPASLKVRLESLIVSLGGTTIRDFDPAIVTHLILDEARGSKYEYVKRNQEREFAKRLKVVTSEWVWSCERERRRVDESLYGLEDQDVEKEKWDEGLPKEMRTSLLEACDYMLNTSFPRMFTDHNFLLVGFDLNEQSLDSTSYENQNIQVMVKLSKLIQRAGGTIYWSPSDVIGVVVLSDCCSEEQWDDVRLFCQQHPRGPMAVTADWILSSLHNQSIKPPPFPPMPTKITVQPIQEETKQTAEVTSKKVTIYSNLFYGDIFAIVRPKPPKGTVSFEKSDMESLITSNGGLLLTKPLFDAVKIDLQSASKNNMSLSRNFYVLSSGGYGDHTKLDPLLADLSKSGVKFLSVSPVWMKACINDQIKYNPIEHPLLFQPQPYPLRLLPPNQFLISLTGFIDASRYGIIAMLREIGAEYTDNLKSKNTHLICKEASGKKFEKACEWGLHVVSLDWLFHVVKCGYRRGCEEEFSLVTPNDRKGLTVARDVKSKQIDPVLSTNTAFAKSLCNESKSLGNDVCKETKPHPSVDPRIKLEHKPPETAAAPPRTETEEQPSQSSFQNVTNSILSAIKSLTPSKDRKRKRMGLKEDSIEDDDRTSNDDVNKRLHSALQSLETSNKPNTHQRRSKRQRQVAKTSQKSPSLLTQHSPHSDDEYPQTEQFTIAGGSGTEMNSFSHDDSVPQSQVDDAQDLGESQVVWFGGGRV